MVKKYQVVYSLRANEDLDKILHYHLNDSGSKTAISTLNQIRKKVDSVLAMPEAYPLYRPGGRTFKRAYRYIVAKKKYRIIYTIRLDAEVVRIIRIVHVRAGTGNMIMALEEE